MDNTSFFWANFGTFLAILNIFLYFSEELRNDKTKIDWTFAGVLEKVGVWTPYYNER